MSDILYRVEYVGPDQDLVSIISKPSSAMRLIRKLIAVGIPHQTSCIETEYMTNRDIEDMIDKLERRYKALDREKQE